jgi:hypothetical protein
MTVLSPQGEPRIVNADPSYPRPRLIAPTALGYIYLAAAISPPSRLPFVLPSGKRRERIRTLKTLVTCLARESGVVDVNLFRAIVVPPTGRFSHFMKHNPGRVSIANFDVMALIRAQSMVDAHRVMESAAFRDFSNAMRADSKAFKQMAARNIRRIGDPSLDKDGGLFLFNHFAVADPKVMPALWEHLAGWYAAKTHLDNSVAMAPVDGEEKDYAIVNWARWDEAPLKHFANMLARPTFWKFVTRNLDLNDAVAMPVYCRRA